MTESKSLINSKMIPWRRTMIESVAIVLSILLAFAIDASWDAYKERNQEQAFLVSLLNDFNEARIRIDESIDSHNKSIASGKQLISIYSTNSLNIKSNELETLLGTMFYDWNSLYLPSGSRDALFASGNIEIVSNKKLRAMLASWPSRVSDSAEDERFITNNIMLNSVPYLHSKIRTRNVARFTYPKAAEHLTALESVNYDALWNDPVFDNIISFRILNETYAVSENGKLRTAADEIIRVIEEELKK